MSWCKFERGWLDSSMFGDAPYDERSAWAWMIGEARFVDGFTPIHGSPMPVKRGQFYASVRFMSEKFKWSKDRVTRFLKRLEKWSSIRVESATGQNLITICNYDEYQGDKDTPKDGIKDSTKDTPKDDPKDKLKEIQEIQEGKEKSIEAAGATQKPRGMRLEAYLEQNGIETVCQELGKWSLEQGMTAEQINWEMQKFRDWWKASAGAKGVKLDWPATWRTWCRSFLEKQREQERRNAVYQNRK